MKLRLSTGVALLFVLLAPLTVRAELSKQDRDSAKSMIAGTLYLRLDVPCRYGRGWGIAGHHTWNLCLRFRRQGMTAERKLCPARKAQAR